MVRHATAGTKRTWNGPDLARPLDVAGEQAAERLAGAIARHPIRRLISSPAVRCIQTLSPLAELCDLPIELWDGLGPDANTSNLVDCFTNHSLDDAVLCTHGEVMSPLLATAAFRTLMRDGPYGRAALLAKGTAWRLRLSHKGKLIGFKRIAPTP